jgi:hypothetical protein
MFRMENSKPLSASMSMTITLDMDDDGDPVD